MSTKLLLFSALGGLCLLLFGMRTLSLGLQKIFGRGIRLLLPKMAQSPLKSMGVGALISAVVQSFNRTSVAIIGLLNARLFGFTSALSGIVGAGLGVALLPLIASFPVGKYSLPMIGIGFLFNMISRKDSLKQAGEVLLGLGVVFLGINIMSGEWGRLSADSMPIHLIHTLAKSPLLGFLVGIFLSALTQSISAIVIMLMAMGFSTHSVDLHTSIPIVLGANLGVNFPLYIKMWKDKSSSKKVVLANLLFKAIIAGGILLGILPCTEFIKRVCSFLPCQIAYFHLLFNIIAFLLFIPVSFVLRDSASSEASSDEGPMYLNPYSLGVPLVALYMSQKETIHMSKIALSMIEKSFNALFKKDKSSISFVKEKENLVDLLDNQIEDFLSKIDKDAFSGRERMELALLLHAISDIERIADHANNMCELAELKMARNIKFSDVAYEELERVFEKTVSSMRYCIDVIREGDSFLIKKILEIEKEVDRLVLHYEDNHMERLESGSCTPEAGPIYLDLLRNLERITDHTHNIAYAKQFGF